jgi:hypothetical protein
MVFYLNLCGDFMGCAMGCQAGWASGQTLFRGNFRLLKKVSKVAGKYMENVILIRFYLYFSTTCIKYTSWHTTADSKKRSTLPAPHLRAAHSHIYANPQRGDHPITQPD